MKTMLISEDEKNRILKMHKEATKKHYLGEQQIPSQTQGLFTIDGTTYRLPCITSNDTLSRFINFAGTSIPNKLNQLKQLGVDYKPTTGTFNPFDINIDWTNPQKYNQYLGNAQSVIEPFTEGLKKYAMINPKPEQIQALIKVDSMNPDIKNYFDVLGKLVSNQKKVINCTV